MGKKLTIAGEGIKVDYDIDTLMPEVDVGYKVWIQDKGFKPYIELKFKERTETLYLKDAKVIEHEQWQKGFGQGITSRFSQFVMDGEELFVTFETLIWIDNAFNDLHFEIIPIREEQGCIRKIAWPGPFVFSERDSKNYTVLPQYQGVLIPSDLPEQFKMYEKGKYHTRAFYMPWWGQIDKGSGYIAIAETPWDGGVDFSHPAGGPTGISPVWYPSLGKLEYNRKIKYSFIEHGNYNDLCKIYRTYVKQNGEFVTLEEKALKNPYVNKIIGVPIVHSLIYYHIEPISAYYNIEENERLIPFAKRSEQLRRLKALGVDKLYLHMDGWGKRGYDNLHPDILPPCEQAGGWEGMKELSDTCKELDYIFATHDQYWCYFKDAETYDPEQAMYDEDGKLKETHEWYGGEQAYMCAHFMLHYIKRNFESLKKNGIELKGTYFDCLSVAELDECFHNEHRLTRKQCLEERRKCMEYARSEGILSSSEETIDWAVPSMDLVHRAPYETVNEVKGIPVPLSNLVYHDCIVTPWIITGKNVGSPDNCFLHALLNGGAPYLGIEADKDEISKNRIVCELHKKVGKSEMLKHEFINGNIKRQRTTFADGTSVEVDFDTNEYLIKEIEK